jgi:hypothetical protein
LRARAGCGVFFPTKSGGVSCTPHGGRGGAARRVLGRKLPHGWRGGRGDGALTSPRRGAAGWPCGGGGLRVCEMGRCGDVEEIWAGGALSSPRRAGRGVAFPQGGCGAAGRGQRRGEARRGQRRSAETGRWGGWSLCRAAGGKCEGAGQPFFGRATWGCWAEGVCGGRGDGRWPPHGGRVTVGRVDEKNLVG